MIEEYETEFNKLKEDIDKEEGKFRNSDNKQHFKAYQPPQFNKDKPKCFLAFGDEKGFIKLWDISIFLNEISHNT